MGADLRIEIQRRLKGSPSAEKCYICKDVDFRLELIQGIKATVCNSCGHVDFFMEIQDANQDGGDQTIPKR
jgi:hypothetical protein